MAQSSARSARRAAVADELRRNGIDGAVVCSPESVTWLSGATIPTQRIIRDRLSMVAVTARGGDGRIVTSTVERNLARQQADVPEATYTEFVENPIVAGVGVLRELDPTVRTVGIETSYLPAERFAELVAGYPDLTFVPLGPWFAAMRQLKDGDEVARLAELGRATQAVIQAGFAFASAGVTERAVYNRLLGEIVERGYLLNHGTLSAGENVSRSHHRAGATALRPGDLVRLDLGMVKDGYVSDIARMAVVGEPSERQASRYAFTLEAERWLISRLRPGVDTLRLFAQWHERLASAGATTSMALLAHGIGLGLHEEPQVTVHAPATVRPGMVMCVEPIVEYPDGETYHVEDLVLITDGEPTYLTDPSDAESMTLVDTAPAGVGA